MRDAGRPYPPAAEMRPNWEPNVSPGIIGDSVSGTDGVHTRGSTAGWGEQWRLSDWLRPCRLLLLRRDSGRVICCRSRASLDAQSLLNASCGCRLGRHEPLSLELRRDSGRESMLSHAPASLLVMEAGESEPHDVGEVRSAEEGAFDAPVAANAHGAGLI